MIAGVSDTVVGRTSRMGGGGMGRGRASSIWRHCSEKDSSIERAVGSVGSLERGKATETNENGRAVVLQPCEHFDPERSIRLMEARELELEELLAAAGIISKDQGELSSNILHAEEFSNGHLQSTLTPIHSQESHFLAELLARPPTTKQPHNKSLPAVVGGQSCHGCKALQVSNHQIIGTVRAMEIKISNLSEMVAELNERLNQMSKQKTSKSSFRQSDEVFTDKRLMRIKAAAFVTGRPLSAHMCKRLVLDVCDNEPPCVFNSDDIKSINDQRKCRDAQSLSKWAVFETFSLQELVGRNCLGGGRDTSAHGNAEIKKPFDECKMEIIENAVFQLYPQQNAAVRKAAWMKCVDKINTDVRYLFKVSLKKHEWLQLGI